MGLQNTLFIADGLNPTKQQHGMHFVDDYFREVEEAYIAY